MNEPPSFGYDQRMLGPARLAMHTTHTSATLLAPPSSLSHTLFFPVCARVCVRAGVRMFVSADIRRNRPSSLCSPLPTPLLFFALSLSVPLKDLIPSVMVLASVMFVAFPNKRIRAIQRRGPRFGRRGGYWRVARRCCGGALEVLRRLTFVSAVLSLAGILLQYEYEKYILDSESSALAFFCSLATAPHIPTFLQTRDRPMPRAPTQACT